MTHTVAGLFDDHNDVTQVVQGLTALGIKSEDISVVTHTDSTIEHRTLPSASAADAKAASAGKGAAVGGALGGAAGLIAALGATAVPGVGWALAAGPIATILAGAGLGAVGGGLIGGLINTGIPERQARFLAEGIRRGGTVVSVSAPDEQVERIEYLMREHHAADIDERMAAWRATTPPATETQPSALENRPGPTYPQEGAGGGVWSGVAPHTNDEKAIEEHARAEWLETTHGESVGPESGQPEAHPFDADFHDHHHTIYGALGRPYEDYDWAYRYGAAQADSLHFAGRDWQSAAPEIQAEWEVLRPGTWHQQRDAVRYGWGRTRGANYSGPERRTQPRLDQRYFW
jgi:hypothetical protein